MPNQKTASTRSDRLVEMIETKIGVKGRGLEEKLRRAGRRLPKRVRSDAMQLVEAERLMAHPKLAMKANTGGLDRAYRRCADWLNGVDRSEQRKSFWLGILAQNAFNVLFVAVAFLLTVRLAGLV